jgi:hypothetical protein
MKENRKRRNKIGHKEKGKPINENRKIRQKR